MPLRPQSDRGSRSVWPPSRRAEPAEHLRGGPAVAAGAMIRRPLRSLLGLAAQAAAHPATVGLELMLMLIVAKLVNRIWSGWNGDAV